MNPNYWYPLEWSDRLAPGGRFDLAAWRGDGGIAYTLSVENGRLISSRGGAY